MAKKRSKYAGCKLKIDYAYGNRMVKNAAALDEAVRQDSRESSAQEFLHDNTRKLLEHLERGEVFYKGELTVPSSRDNKQPSTLIVLRTLLNSVEMSWIVRHEVNTSYYWEANCTCVGSAFGAFRICSCDVVSAVY